MGKTYDYNAQSTTAYVGGVAKSIQKHMPKLKPTTYNEAPAQGKPGKGKTMKGSKGC